MEPLHPRREIRLWRLDDQMHVVAHEAIREYMPAESLDHPSKELQILRVVSVIAEDARPPIAARHGVIDAARNQLANGPSHTSKSGLSLALTPAQPSTTLRKGSDPLAHLGRQ